MTKCDKCKGTIGLYLWYTGKPLDNYFPSPILLCHNCDDPIKHDISARKTKFNPLIHSRDLGLTSSKIIYCWKNLNGQKCKSCSNEIKTNECGKKFNYGPEIDDNRPATEYFCLDCFMDDILINQME